MNPEVQKAAEVEAKKRYPEELGPDKDAQKKQRRNQKYFIEGYLSKHSALEEENKRLYGLLQKLHNDLMAQQYSGNDVIKLWNLYKKENNL